MAPWAAAQAENMWQLIYANKHLWRRGGGGLEGAGEKNPGGFPSYATCTDLHCASLRLEKPDERNYCDPEHSGGALKKVERHNLGFICEVSLPVSPYDALKSQCCNLSAHVSSGNI